METCTLPTGASDPSSHHNVVPMTRYDDTSLQQPRKGTFLTETAWDFSFLSTNCKRSIGDQVIATQGHAHYVAGNNWNESKAEDISFAEPIGSCSCGSSSSLVRNSMLCTPIQLSNSVILQTLFRKQSKVQRPCRSCSNPNADQMKTDVMNFTNLVKQRAFHLKPPCLPTSSSPSKRAPGASPRRVTSAPACSRKFFLVLLSCFESGV
ncbi:unnamed protein product [Phytophthora lilii]|uniref:Unnamed protein product n=1 Tax=Phytophthora lilii TaxID=2077276 RepID=A0A9W6XE45_9STRA|nr:unnamed protein product [Phytophthora lilii]